MNTYKTLDVQLVLDVADDAEAADAANEILREHQRSFAPLSCLIDYSHGAYRDSGQTVDPSYEEGSISTFPAEPESEFTQAEQAAIHSMRSKGFAVAVFTPKELAATKRAPADLEAVMVEFGNAFIDNNLE